MSEKFSQGYGTITFLDALGTKGIWKGKNPEIILNNWEELISTLSLDVNLAAKQGLELTHYAFSDTLIIIISGEMSSKTEILTETSNMLSSFVAYGITKGINFRGATSLGRYHKSNQMILGPAVDEAAMFFEKSNWIGVMATPSVESVLIRNEKEGKKVGFFCRYKIPIHDGIYSGWAIELPDYASFGNSLIDIIHEWLEDSDDPTGADKWKNTLEFLYHINQSNPKK